MLGRIARQFLITGIFWAFMGAAMSIIFRLQLGFPDADLAWLKPLLGKWIQVNDIGIGKLDPEFYYSLVTMHGTILVFFVLTAGLSGTFSNLLIHGRPPLRSVFAARLPSARGDISLSKLHTV